MSSSKSKSNSGSSPKKGSAFWAPFRVYKRKKLTFSMWTSFSLIGGAVGILVSIVRHWLFTPKSSIGSALIIEGNNGAFFTYSIALIAATLGTVFISFVDNKHFRFRKYKIVLISISVYALLFGGIMYALSIGGSPEILCVSYWCQLFLLILAFFLSIYAFFVCRMDEHIDLFDDIIEAFSEENSENEDFPDEIPENK